MNQSVALIGLMGCFKIRAGERSVRKDLGSGSGDPMVAPGGCGSYQSSQGSYSTSWGSYLSLKGSNLTVRRSYSTLHGSQCRGRFRILLVVLRLVCSSWGSLRGGPFCDFRGILGASWVALVVPKTRAPFHHPRLRRGPI